MTKDDIEEMTLPMPHTAAVEGHQKFEPQETSLASMMSHVVHKQDLKREDPGYKDVPVKQNYEI